MDKKRENNKTDGLIIKNRSKPLVNSNQTEEEYADMKEEELKKFHSPREEFKRKYRRYPSVDELNQYNKNKSNY